jgi:hypothetical protein
MKSRWIEHKGKRVFIADYSGFGADPVALQAEIEPAIDTLVQEPLDSALVVALLSGTAATIGNMNIIRELLPRSNEHVHRRAVVGVSGAQRLLLETFTKFTGRAQLKPFETMEQALDWIVQE